MTLVEVLLDHEIQVEYGQFYVAGEEGGGYPDMLAGFQGQVNGLCGAALPSSIFFVTGLNRGRVGIRVEAHRSRPPLDKAWTDVVEASFSPASDQVALLTWDNDCYPLRLTPDPHRVRYSARGMDEAHAVETSAVPIDNYLLQFWPCPVIADEVIAQGSDFASRCHQRQREQAGRNG